MYELIITIVWLVLLLYLRKKDNFRCDKDQTCTKSGYTCANGTELTSDSCTCNTNNFNIYNMCIKSAYGYQYMWKDTSLYPPRQAVVIGTAWALNNGIISNPDILTGDLGKIYIKDDA